MPESLFVYKDITISDKDWNTKRFDRDIALKVAAKIEGSAIQYRPADTYYGQKVGQVGQRNEGYVVLAKYGYVVAISENFLKEHKMPSNIQYLGSCVNSFDPDSGDSLIPIFTDVSDFANKEETFRDRVENGEDDYMGFGDFVGIVGTHKFLKSYFEFYFYPQESGNIYVAYNPKKDIHYFFA